MKASSKYRIHRTIAIIVIPLLILSTATGFFRANQKWYWPDGYKKKKQPSSIAITEALVPIEKLTYTIDSVSANKNTYEQINLKSENGILYYEFVTSSKAKFLAEAHTGKIVSPLTPDLASDMARQYVKEKPEIKSCELLTNYIPRKGKEKKPAYRIAFANHIQSEIYLDYYTGDILEDTDKNRQFGLWINRLHDYDFFDSKRSISSAVGIGLFFLILSGLWIYKFRLSVKKAKL